MEKYRSRDSERYPRDRKKVIDGGAPLRVCYVPGGKEVMLNG